MRCRVLVLFTIMFQLVWIGGVNGSLDYVINYDPNFDAVASRWSNSTWHPSPYPADYWIRAENGIVTLYYKGNRTDWGNTELYQGKKPAFEVEQSLRFQDFSYIEGLGSLRLIAKVKRDIDPVWQGSSLNMSKSQCPQANIGVYIWFEVQGWNYDDWNKTSSLVIDIYFDSRYQNSNTNETKIREVGWSYPPTTTPYDKQIHVGYVIGNLSLNAWQVFNVSVSALIDRTFQQCKEQKIELPSSEVVIKLFGVYVDSFSAGVQASFDYVLLKDVRNEELNAEIENLSNELNSTLAELKNTRSLMYTFRATTIAFMATTVASAVIAVYYVKKFADSSRKNRTTR